MRKNKVDVIQGYGQADRPGASDGILTVDVEGRADKSTIKAKNVILCTGSVARILPGLHPDDRNPDQHRGTEP